MLRSLSRTAALFVVVGLILTAIVPITFASPRLIGQRTNRSDRRLLHHLHPRFISNPVIWSPANPIALSWPN